MSRSPHRPLPLSRTLSRCTAVAAMASVIASCSSGGGDTAVDGNGEALTEVSFRFDVTASGYVAPFVYAQDQGWYAEEGLTVEFGEGTGSDTTVQLVAEGRDDFGWADFGEMTVLRSRGADVKAVAVYGQRSPVSTIVLADSGISEPADLEGRQMVMGSGDLALWEALVASTGIDGDAVELVTMAESAQSQALLQGRVDALVGWATFQSPELEHLGANVDEIVWADHGVNVMNVGIVASDSMVESNPETVCGFVRASRRGWEAALESPAVAIDALVAQYPNVDPEIALRQFEKQRGLLHTDATEGKPLGFVAQEDVDRTQEVLLGAGQLESVTDSSELYTNECYDS